MLTKEDEIREVARLLRATFRDHAHGNKTDPVNELIFIMCSVMTGFWNYESTYRALKRKYPSHAALSRATVRGLEKPLNAGGLSRTKARAIKRILRTVVKDFGRLSLSSLASKPDVACEDYLRTLPGVGKKVARCVMMYSLGRQVFPVDTHCWRICRRLGWIRPTTQDGHPSPRDMDRLQDKIPPDLRFTLHVNMVSLGREFCRANNPDCGGCLIDGKKLGSGLVS